MLKGNTSAPQKTHPEFSILLSSKNKNHHLHVKKHEKNPDLYTLPIKHQNGLTKTKKKQSKLQKTGYALGSEGDTNSTEVAEITPRACC